MKLKTLNNYGMQIILQVPSRTPSSMLRTKLQWMTLKQRRPLQQLKAVYWCEHGMAPEYLQSLFSCQPGTVCTCGQMKLSLRVHTIEIFGKSLQHSGAKSWNLLSDHIKTTPSYLTFASQVKHFISEYW